MYQSFEIEILKTLYQKQDWVNVYYFHEKYLLSAGQISNFIRRYGKFEIINFKNYEIKLTAKGINWLIANRRHIFLTKKNRHWAYFKADPKLKIGDPYLPNLHSISHQLRKKSGIAPNADQQ
ncbi:hypothetical protein [Radicibacter daui]|uniref:hypothetical protein n=1 Tax=Radicibacter daui TaxID=3064829 RepID=UPI00404696CA